jgi:hypothetical protein
MLYWGREVGQRPQDFVDARVPAWEREAIAFVLKNGIDAHPGIQAMGWANCRLCGANLGSRDFTRFGYVWPEKAEHYLSSHGVWTPECSSLLQRALSRSSSSAM